MKYLCLWSKSQEEFGGFNKVLSSIKYVTQLTENNGHLKVGADMADGS